MTGPVDIHTTSTATWTFGEKLQLGDLLFVRGCGLVDRAIQWVTHGPYNHVAIYVGNGRIVEAVPPRVHEIANPYPDADVVHVPHESNEDRQRGVAIARSWVGKRYSRASIASDLLLWLGSPIDFDATHAVNCAELAALRVGRGIDYRGISPNGLRQELARMAMSDEVTAYTRDQFINDYYARTGMNPDCRVEDGYKLPDGLGLVAYPCDCGENGCRGWAMFPRMRDEE